MRTAEIKRDTRETQIEIAINLDGTGKNTIDTGVPFLNHMLELFSRHSLIDITLKATGDVDVDDHHTVEDIGIVLGEALNKALLDRRGIHRYGSIILPMDETLVDVAIDLGGRPYFVYNVTYPTETIKTFSVRLVEEFLRAFVTEARLNLHVALRYGDETHHICEGVFKGVARALREALAIDVREKGIPSSKGVL